MGHLNWHHHTEWWALIQTPAGDVEGLLDWAALTMVFGSQARVVWDGAFWLC